MIRRRIPHNKQQPLSTLTISLVLLAVAFIFSRYITVQTRPMRFLSEAADDNTLQDQEPIDQSRCEGTLKGLCVTSQKCQQGGGRSAGRCTSQGVETGKICCTGIKSVCRRSDNPQDDKINPISCNKLFGICVAGADIGDAEANCRAQGGNRVPCLSCETSDGSTAVCCVREQAGSVTADGCRQNFGGRCMARDECIRLNGAPLMGCSDGGVCCYGASYKSQIYIPVVLPGRGDNP